MALSNPLGFTGVGGLSTTQTEAMDGSLDLFEDAIHDTSMESFRESDYSPASLNNRGPFEFTIPSQGDDLYTDLSKVRLYGQCRIMKYNDAGAKVEIDADDPVTIVNFFPMALFKAVETSISNINISYIATPNFQYKAYFSNLLSYGGDAQASHLKACLWHMDEVGKFDDVGNSGAVERKK